MSVDVQNHLATGTPFADTPAGAAVVDVNTKIAGLLRLARFGYAIAIFVSSNRKVLALNKAWVRRIVFMEAVNKLPRFAVRIFQPKKMSSGRHLIRAVYEGDDFYDTSAGQMQVIIGLLPTQISEQVIIFLK